MRLIALHTFLIGFFGLWCSFAFAQTISQDASITLIPSNPKPGQVLTAQLESFDVDLSKSLITWNYNGKKIESGIGKTVVSVTAPSTSTQVVLSAIATGQEGVVQASISIWPASVDLIWEAADAYTPPFYKGKALAPINGLIKVAAIPHISAPRNSSFSWEKDTSALPLQSGTNKNSVSFIADPLNTNEEVSVTVRGGTFSASNTLTIPTRPPAIVAYRKKEGFIDFSKGFIDTILLAEGGSRIFFAPFNFSILSDPIKDLSIEILSGTDNITNEGKPTELLISSDSNGSQITTSFESIKRPFQQIKKRFDIGVE